MIKELGEIQALATKYSKAQLGRMVQMGMIDPQKAMMAGMMIQRIEAQNAEPPQTTVAQEVLGLPAVGGQPQQAPQQGQPQQPQQAQQTQQAPQMGAPVEQPPQMAASGGLTDIPVEMQDYAGGGIVAFGDGGDVPGYNGQGLFGSLVGGNGMGAPVNMESDQTLTLMREARERDVAETDKRKAEYAERLDVIRQKMAAGTALTPQEQTLANYNSLTPLPAISNTPYPDESRRGSATFTRPGGAVANLSADRGANRNANASVRNVNADAGSNSGARVTSKLPPLERPQFGAFDPNAVKLKGPAYDMPTIGKLEDITKEREGAEAAAGYNKNLTAEQIARLEGKKGELDTRKSQAGGEALMQFGLGLIGARKGQEFQAVGESGKAALGAYKNDVKDLRSAQEKLEERTDALRVADNQAKKSNSAADIAKRDTQQAKYDAAKLEVFKADNELTKTGALISSQTRGQDMTTAAQLYNVDTTARTAREGHQTQLQVAGIQASAQKAYALAVKEGQLDANIAKIMLDAEKNFMESQAANYIGKPNELAAAAREHAKNALQQYLPNSRPAANSQQVSPAPGGNRPPLTQFGS